MTPKLKDFEIEIQKLQKNVCPKFSKKWRTIHYSNQLKPLITMHGSKIRNSNYKFATILFKFEIFVNLNGVKISNSISKNISYRIKFGPMHIFQIWFESIFCKICFEKIVEKVPKPFNSPKINFLKILFFFLFLTIDLY